MDEERLSVNTDENTAAVEEFLPVNSGESTTAVEELFPANTDESNAAVNEEAPKQNKGNTFFAKLFRPENRKKTVIGLVISVLLIAVVCFTLFYMSPKQIAIRYAKAVASGNENSISSMSAYDYISYLMRNFDDEDAFYESMSEQFDEDIESWNDYCKVRQQYMSELYEDVYGKYSLSFKVTKEKDYSVRKFITENQSAIEEYTAYGVFDADEITDAKLIGVKVKVDGEDHKNTYVFSIAMCKVHGIWKVLDYDIE